MSTLRELRLQKLWSQRELARRAGVAEQTVVSIETGQRQPRLASIRKIADVLGVEWSEVEEFQKAIDDKAAAERDLRSATRPVD